MLPHGHALMAAADAAQRDGEQACRMALSFLQACCTVVPLLLIALIAAADEPAREEQDGVQPDGLANAWLPARLTALGDSAAAAGTAAALRLQQQTLAELAALLWVGSTLTWLLIKTATA